MITTQLNYPGDPPKLLFLMWGKEFRDQVRMGHPAKIKVEIEGGEAKSFPVHEILCDFCSREIRDDQPLALITDPDRVYCWPCHENLNGPYIEKA
jgi:hypothetical protein